MRNLEERLDGKEAGMPRTYGLLFAEQSKLIYAPFVPRRRADEFFRIEEKLLVKESGDLIQYLELDNEKDEVYYSSNQEIEVHNSEPWIDEDGYVDDMGDTTSGPELYSLFAEEVIERGGPWEYQLSKEVLLPGGSSLRCRKSKNSYFLELDGTKIRGTESAKRIIEVFLLDFNEKYAHAAYTVDEGWVSTGVYAARIELANGTAKTRSLTRIDDYIVRPVESRILDLKLRRMANSLK